MYKTKLFHVCQVHKQVTWLHWFSLIKNQTSVTNHRVIARYVIKRLWDWITCTQFDTSLYRYKIVMLAKYILSWLYLCKIFTVWLKCRIPLGCTDKSRIANQRYCQIWPFRLICIAFLSYFHRWKFRWHRGNMYMFLFIT